MLTVVNANDSTLNGSLIDEIVREGARRMLAAALEAEVDAYIAELANERDAGLSPATVTRLTAQWQDDHASFQDRNLSGIDYVIPLPPPTSTRAISPDGPARA